MIRFVDIQEKPEAQLTKEILTFYASIFEKTDAQKFDERISKAVDLLINLAFYENRIVGFKIGYKIEPKKFYSWVGGVDRNFRGRGIAAELMRRQHDWCVRKGFETIRTKTKNCFKSMLILNIKNGFDIIEVYKSAQNELKLVLEKPLAVF